MTKVLIIEDDPIIANIYRSRLDKEGFQVEIAADGQSGFYRIHESHPEALLLDLMLRQDGWLADPQEDPRPEAVPKHARNGDYQRLRAQHDSGSRCRRGATHVFNKAALTPRQIIDAINQALFPRIRQAGSAFELRTCCPLATGGSDISGNATQNSGSGGAARCSGSCGLCNTPRQPETGIPMPAMYVPPQSKTAPVSGIVPGSDARCACHIQRQRCGFPSRIAQQFSFKRPRSIYRNCAELLHEFLKNSNAEMRVGHLTELYRKVHSITSNAAVVGLQNIAQLCAALEALLRELSEKPKNITASTLRTVTHAIDFLGVLFDKGAGPYLLDHPPIRILVVDDEIISRRAVIYALEKGSLKAEGMDDPMAASKVLAERSFDLVVLDVDLPAMNGFELCTKLRTYPSNQTTPRHICHRFDRFRKPRQVEPQRRKRFDCQAVFVYRVDRQSLDLCVEREAGRHKGRVIFFLIQIAMFLRP